MKLLQFSKISLIAFSSCFILLSFKAKFNNINSTGKKKSAKIVQTNTVHLNFNNVQGFYQDYYSGGGTYYTDNNSRLVGIFNLPNPRYQMLRYKFSHPNIPNNKITNVKLNLTIASSVYSGSDPSYVQVQIPYSSCNNSVSWSNTSQSGFQSLQNCIENAYLVTTYSVASGGTGQANYSRNINNTSSPNLTALLQDPYDFTFAMFSQLSYNAVRIAAISVDITYNL